MKKFAIASVTVSIIAAGSILGYRSFQQSQRADLTPLMLENIEALTNAENPVRIPCRHFNNTVCRYSIVGVDGTLGTAETYDAIRSDL